MEAQVQARRNFLELVRANAEAPDCPDITEGSLPRRLAAAYTLRGSFVEVLPNIHVGYSVLPHMNLFQVVTCYSTRPWGSVADVQDLSDRVFDSYPKGVLLLHHELCAACHFRSVEAPLYIDIPRALSYAARFGNCLVLARVRDEYGKVVFARVVVKREARDRLDEEKWFRDYLAVAVLQVPNFSCHSSGSLIGSSTASR
jgi:hypothetical protein